jgi:GH43 family beta-xylosidase
MNCEGAASLYINPVYNSSCPDPFVLKHRGEYWCYSTGHSTDGRCFQVLHSCDLINWQAMTGAMEPLPDGCSEYWAPEVTYDNGRFLMYYSVGDGVSMQIRVAVAAAPEGPFLDSGRRLTPEDFAIDAHVFKDDDGSRYLFYATDYLSHSNVGTGTVCDRMLDSFTLAGDARPVTLACYDWHVFDPARAEKGGVRWHTIEGPFVFKNKGLYYQMFSAGNWKNTTYGVSYAVTDNLTGGEWRQVADGERVLPILRTIPGRVIGPGHNSVVRGPDNQQLFCIYHRWSEDRDTRVLAIDRLDWAGDRLLVIGPTTTSQPAPLLPTLEDAFNINREEGPGNGWKCSGGHWSVRSGEARQTSTDAVAEASVVIGASYFVLEVSLRALAETSDGAFGLELRNRGEAALRVMLLSSPNRASITWRSRGGWVDRQVSLPEQFVPDAYHLLRVECNGSAFNVAVDGVAARWAGRYVVHPQEAVLLTRGMSAAFSAFSVTIGWKDNFVDEVSDPAELGWQAQQNGDDWQIADGRLWINNIKERGASVFKGPALESYELVVNARLDLQGDSDGCYGFYPAAGPIDPGPLLKIESGSSGWCISTEGPSDLPRFPLPPDFDPFTYQQFRVRNDGGLVTVWCESALLGSLRIPKSPARVGLYARNAVAGFDLVRVTKISHSQWRRRW